MPARPVKLTKTEAAAPRLTCVRKRPTMRSAVLLSTLSVALYASATAAAGFHQTTEWDLKPSLKYDTLCILNSLSGDPYYLQYYNESFQRLRPQFTEQEKTAFKNIKAKIKDQHGEIISAKLALYFSVVNAESLDDLLRVVRDSSEMQRNLQATSYYSADGWKSYEEARPDLEAALLALKRVHFDQYWERNIRPAIEEREQAIRSTLPRYNIVPAVESRLGWPLPSNRITVYMLYFSEPHGIRITGTNFLTHYSYPFRIVMRNAIHELMHPPYDAAHNSAVKEAIESLRADSFLMDKVEHHDRSLGYNTLEGLVEEDCVQALEQNVAEQFDAGGDLKGNPRQYWAEQDGGIHVLAVALYSLMQQEGFPAAGEDFSRFLVRMARSGRLSSGHIEALNKTFFTANAPK